MTKYSSADQLLRLGEVGLFIFTDGTDLTINTDGSGSTGYWVVDPRRRVDWVIIYKRDPQDQSHNELFMARSGNLEGPWGDRYLINLRDVELVGFTDVNWREFAGDSSNPIRYLSRE